MKRFALVCAVVGLCCLASPAQAQKLLSYFDLEEGMGTAVTGVGGNFDTNGTVQNPTGADWVAGAPGGFSPTTGYDFDGGTEYILTDATALDYGIDGNFSKSVSVWALTREFQNGGLYDIGQGGADGQDFSLRTLTGTDSWRAQFWGAPDFDFTAPGSLNNWSHFVLTHDGTIGRAYYNGQLIGSEASILNTIPTLHPFQIGNYSANRATPGGDEFNGVIDDVVVYGVDTDTPIDPKSGALMPNQVLHLYNGGDPNLLPGPETPTPRTGRYLYAQQPNGKWNRIELFSAFDGANYDEATAMAEDSEYAHDGITGHLATPRSQIENHRIAAVRGSGNMWIGLDDKAVEGDWALADDGQVIWQGLGSGGTPPGAPVGGAYTQWNGTAEPNDAGGNEDAAEILANGNWNDLPHADTAAYSREFAVEYETQLDEKPPVPLINDGPSGGDGTFGVRTIRVSEAIPGGLYGAESSLYRGKDTEIVDSQEPDIHFEDPDNPGGGQIRINPRPYPNDTPGVDDNFYVMKAKGRIVIETAGDYTFAFRGDDGAELKIEGQTWIEAGNAGGNGLASVNNYANVPGDTLRLPINGGNLLATGRVNLAAGEYDIEFTHFENTGGADIELLAAPGNQTEINDEFVLIGHIATGETTEYGKPGLLGQATVSGSPPGGTALNNLADAAAEIAAGSLTTLTYDSVNFADPGNDGGGGNFGGNNPFPGGTAADDNDFAIEVEATLQILLAGQYRLGFRGDDGSELRIVGQSFTDIVTDATGNAVIAADGALQVDVNTGNSTAEALIDLEAGTYALEALFWERGGGANFEIWGASPLDPAGNELLVNGGADVFSFTDDKDGLQLVSQGEEVLLGDSNLDGDVNGLDIDPFVAFVLGTTYQAQSDVNEDGAVDGVDIDPFVQLILGGGAAAVPEPSTMILAALAALALLGFGWRRTR